MSPPHLWLQIGDGMALCRVVRADTMFCGRVIDIVGERAAGRGQYEGCMLEMYLCPIRASHALGKFFSISCTTINKYKTDIRHPKAKLQKQRAGSCGSRGLNQGFAGFSYVSL